MYAEQYAPLQKKNSDTKTNSNSKNLTGIPAPVKNRYEAASGLSFDDVRVHYNSAEPAKLGALAYTKGNHVYIGRGQEKHLGHELGHVIQQKRGLVRPNTYINGLPVNTDRRLEQQAESGTVTFDRTVREGGQEIVQGVFLMYESPEQGGLLVKCEESVEGRIDTKELSKYELFELLPKLKEPDLITVISKEICDAAEEDIKYGVIDLVDGWGADAAKILSAMCSQLCEWLVEAAGEIMDEQDKKSDYYKKAEKVFGLFHIEHNAGSGAQAPQAGPGAQAPQAAMLYDHLRERITKLRDDIYKISRENGNKERKSRLATLIGSLIINYKSLCRRFMHDRYIIDKILDELNAQINFFNEILGIFSETGPIDIISAERVQSTGLPGAYAREKLQETALPPLKDLPDKITERCTVRRNLFDETGKPKRYPDFDKITARNLLLSLQETSSQEKLVIYRSMDAEKAIPILCFFDSGKAAEAEEKIIDGSFEMSENQSNPLIAEFGKHFGEREQAMEYDVIRPFSDDKPNYALVTLAFILKPGASKLLFSPSLIAVPPASIRMWNDKRWDPFQRSSLNEGVLRGYIGIKHEQVRDKGASNGRESKGVSKPTYSLCVATGATGDTQLLLQLLIDRVEVVKIRY